MNNKEKVEKFDILDCVTMLEKCPHCGEDVEVRMTNFAGASFKVGLFWKCPKCHKDFYIGKITLEKKNNA